MDKLSYINYNYFEYYLSKNSKEFYEYAVCDFQRLYRFGVDMVGFYNNILGKNYYIDYHIPADEKIADLLDWKLYLEWGYELIDTLKPVCEYMERVVNETEDVLSSIFVHTISLHVHKADIGTFIWSFFEAAVEQLGRFYKYYIPRPIMLPKYLKKEEKASFFYKKALGEGNQKKAFKYFKKSAKYTYASSYTKLGNLCAKNQDIENAIVWHLKGANFPFFEKDSLVWLRNYYKGTVKELYYLEMQIDYADNAEEIFEVAKFIEQSIILNTINQKEAARLIYKSMASIFGRFSNPHEKDDLTVNEARIWFANYVYKNKVHPDADKLAYALYNLVLFEAPKVIETSDDNFKEAMTSYRENEIKKLDEVLKKHIKSDYIKIKDKFKSILEEYNILRREKEEEQRRQKEEEKKEEEAKCLEKTKHQIELWRQEEAKRQEKIRQMEHMNLSNIFNLDPDVKVYNPKSLTKIESNSNLSEKEYKKALVSKDEKTIITALENASELYHTKAIAALFHYYVKKQDLDKAYYYFFKQASLISKTYLSNEMYEKMPLPLDLKRILRNLYDNRSDTYNDELICFINNNITIEKDLSNEQLGLFEEYASKNLLFAKDFLYRYYSIRDEEKATDILYNLANMTEYIDLLINKLGGVEAKLDDRFVQFLLNNKAKSKTMCPIKGINFHLARLYLDKELCKKYNVEYSPEEVKTILYLAYAFGLESHISNIDYALTSLYAKCFEYGIGTTRDYNEAIKLYNECYNPRGTLFKKFLACIPDSLRRIKNFEIIKDYFLENVKMIDYKSIFEEVKRFDNAAYPLEEIFNKEGKYIGYTLMDKLVEKEVEIKRQEELRRQAELKHQEELKRQADLKKQEALRRQAEQSVINSQKSEIPGTKQSPSTTEMTKSNENTISINEIRSRYDRPQGNDEKALKEYFKRLCEAPKPDLYRKLYSEYAFTADYNYITQILGLSKDNTIQIIDFEEKLKEMIKWDCTPSVSMKFNVFESLIEKVNALERFIAGLPVYIGTLNINVSFLQDSKYFSGVNSQSSTIWVNEVERFEETNASNFISAGEYAQKSGLNSYIAALESNEQWNGRKGLRNKVRSCVKELLQEYTVVESALVSVQTGLKKTSEIIPSVIKDIKTSFEFLGDN